MSGRRVEEQTEPMKQKAYIAPKNHLAPMECWERRGDAIVDAGNGRTASDFVGALKNQSAAAWNAVRKIVVDPVLNEKGVRELMRKNKFEDDEQFNIFVERMMAKGRLNRLKEADKLVPFMQKCIRNQIMEHKTKKAKRRAARTIFIEDYFSKPSDVDAKQDVNLIDMIPEDETQAAMRNERLMDDEKAIVRRCFWELWKENPKRAIALSLWNVGLSAHEIKELMGERSDNNVSQLTCRGGKDFSELIRSKKVTLLDVSSDSIGTSRRKKHGR